MSDPCSTRPARLDRRDAAALVGLFLVASLLLAPVLALPANRAPGMPHHDAHTQWYPWRVHAAESLKAGELPLWNPYSLCGTPFIANAQSAVFYPPNIVFLLAPVGIAARLSILFHLWLALLFAYLLARRLGCAWSGASVAAMAFAFAAPQLLRVPAGHWGVSCAIPWLPAILLCAESMIRSRRPALLAAGAFAVAMQVLAGMPQYVIITGLATVVFALCRGLSEPLVWRRRIGYGAQVAAMFVLGAVIAGIQIFPALEAARFGARSLPMRRAWIEFFSLGPENLLTLLAPGFFGGTHGVSYWGRFYTWEMNAYAGLVALGLAIVGLLHARPRRLAAALSVMGGLALLMALGKHTPLQSMALWALPAGGMFRGASKFLLPFTMSLALLAGLGAEVMLGEPKEAWRRARAPMIALLAIVAVVAVLAWSGSGVFGWLRERIIASNAEDFSYLSADNARNVAAASLSIEITLTGALLAGALLAMWVLARGGAKARVLSATRLALVVLVGLDLLYFSYLFFQRDANFRVAGGSYASFASEVRDIAPHERIALISTPALNDGILARFHALQGIEPNPPVWFHRLFMRAHNMPEDIAPSVYQWQPELDLGLARAAGLSRVLLCDVDEEANVRAWRLLTRPAESPRAFVSYDPIFVSSEAAALEKVLDPQSAGRVVIEAADQPTDDAEAAESRVVFLRDEPNEVELRATVTGRRGWLVLKDNYFPGWHADVDGRPAPILKADYAFRAVALPPGEHVVRFVYRPASFIAGCWLSAVGILLAGLLVLRGVRSRHARSESAS